MQKAVDIVQQSAHPTNKIAATLAGITAQGAEFSISRINLWPDAIRDKIGTETRIGNSSGTLHAETACLLAAPRTDGSAFFVTDPPCPNCVKYMAEAGVKALYIDHKGFDKDFAKRRGGHFETMAMRICEHAGIAVYKIFRKEERMEPILQIAPDYKPPIENPAVIESINGEVLSASLLSDYTKSKEAQFSSSPFAIAAAQDENGKIFLISAPVHPVIGYTTETLEKPEEKYSFLLQPVNRLLMTAARYGMRLMPGTLYSSRVPTARELVNLVGAGLTEITIGANDQARDESGLAALQQLEKAGILNVQQ